MTKLLILQALRPEFPNASFFTTDLDALLLPDKKSHYTRNLLVASSYGLKPDERLQLDNISPFRNSYENSAFITALLAVHDALPDMLPAETAGQIDPVIDNTLRHPLLFQIARTGPQPLPTVRFTPVELAGPDPPNGVSATASRVQLSEVGLARVFCGTQWGVFLIPPLLIGCVFCSGRVRRVCFADIGRASPTASRVQPSEVGLARISCGTRLGVFLIPLLLIGCVFASGRVRRAYFADIGRAIWGQYWGQYWSSTPVGRAGPGPPSSRLWLWRFGRGLFSVGAAAPWLTENGLGEPLSVVDGITVWPTVALRSFGILLALFLIWYTVHELEANRRETLERFHELHPYELGKAWNYLRGDEKMSWIAAVRAFLWFPRCQRVRSISVTTILARKSRLRRSRPHHLVIGCFAVSARLSAPGSSFLSTILIVDKVFGDVMINPVRGHRAQNIFILYLLS